MTTGRINQGTVRVCCQRTMSNASVARERAGGNPQRATVRGVRRTRSETRDTRARTPQHTPHTDTPRSHFVQSPSDQASERATTKEKRTPPLARALTPARHSLTSKFSTQVRLNRNFRAGPAAARTSRGDAENKPDAGPNERPSAADRTVIRRSTKIKPSLTE